MMQRNFGTDTIQPGQQPRGAVPAYEEGGAIDTGDNPMMDTLGARLQLNINAALGVIGDVLSYGRKLHGLGGDEGSEDEGAIQTAGRMPTVPGSQSESGIPPQRPRPAPQQPAPFGKRTEGEDNPFATAGVMPSVPHSESQRPQPMPGPLPPTSNPFGKRADAAESDEETSPEEEIMGAIDTEETA